MTAAPKRYPGPYTVEYTLNTVISGTAHEHKLELNCLAVGDPAPGTAFTAINLARVGGGTIAASAAVTDLWTQMRINHSTVTSVLSVVLWRYTPLSHERTFISAYASPLLNGASVTVPNPGHQSQITLRTAGGSYLRVNWIEDVQTAKNQVALTINAAGDSFQRTAALLVSVNGWVLGRDGSWPIAPMKISYTHNEALENKRFRPNS